MMDIILRNINILRNFISFKFITFNKNQAKLIIFNDSIYKLTKQTNYTLAKTNNQKKNSKKLSFNYF